MEWLSIIYLINSQKDRRVEEILFDHNAENVEEKLADKSSFSSSYTYRRKEIVMKGQMLKIGFLYQFICVISIFLGFMPK